MYSLKNHTIINMAKILFFLFLHSFFFQLFAQVNSTYTTKRLIGQDTLVLLSQQINNNTHRNTKLQQNHNLLLEFREANGHNSIIVDSTFFDNQLLKNLHLDRILLDDLKKICVCSYRNGNFLYVVRFEREYSKTWELSAYQKIAVPETNAIPFNKMTFLGCETLLLQHPQYYPNPLIFRLNEYGDMEQYELKKIWLHDDRIVLPGIPSQEQVRRIGKQELLPYYKQVETLHQKNK